jgi:hypothetical protein
MEPDETPINAKIPRPNRVLEAVRSAAEQASWWLRRGIVWPLQDWFESLGQSSRRVLAGGGAVVGLLFAVIVVSLAVGGSSSEEPATASAAVAAAPAATTVEVAPAPAEKQKEAEPTLHGAPPVFKREPPEQVGAAQQAQQSSAPGSSPDRTAKTTEATTASSSSAATDKIASEPTAQAQASSVAGETEAIPGRPAGKRAIAVARRFSQAFVVYETGGKKAPVRKEFAATTTPALAKALLKRPPRLPADVKVPRAKVVTIVPGPSRQGVYTLSVSLLRVGVTSELRLEMEKLKDEGWRVTNVLG